MEVWLLGAGEVEVEAPRHWHSLKCEQPCLPEEIDQPGAKEVDFDYGLLPCGLQFRLRLGLARAAPQKERKRRG